MQILNVTSREYSSATLTNSEEQTQPPWGHVSHPLPQLNPTHPWLPKICLWLQRPGCRALGSLVSGHTSLWVTRWMWATLQVAEQIPMPSPFCPPLAAAAPRLPLAPALQQGWQRLVQGAVERQLHAWPKPAWLRAAAKRSWRALPDDKASLCHRLPSSPAIRQLWDKLHGPSEKAAPSQGYSSGTLHYGIRCSPHGRETRASPTNQSYREYICLQFPATAFGCVSHLNLS